jgi:hypothetical protein
LFLFVFSFLVEVFLYLFFPSNKNYGNSLAVPLKKLERKLEVGGEEGTERAPCTQPKLVGYLVSNSLRDSSRGLLATVAASMGGAGLQYVPSWRKPQHETNCGARRDSSSGRDGFGSDTHEYEFGCHYLPHFISNSDTNANIIECEYKRDISNSDSHSNTYSIYSVES